jgi:Putative Flp pilus-assembly TadE/G-like
MTCPWRQHQRGQVIVWAAVMVPLLFLPIVGLMIDAGILFDAKRDLQNVADGAARVGAMELDERYLRGLDPDARNPTGYVRLDPGAARDQAQAYLRRIDVGGISMDIDAQTDHIEVVVHHTVRTSFLRLVRINSLTIHATGRAEPCAAVAGAQCLPNAP